MLQERDRALTLRRLLLRQIADAFVWHVLRLDARVILPLYREQTHSLPRREGLGGPAELARRAMQSGELFVFENDLTRCLGVGDLTVVFATRPWTHPLTYEVKSSWPWPRRRCATRALTSGRSPVSTSTCRSASS